MIVYTRTGDEGKTSLGNGKRILKSSDQVEAYGSVDELTSYIGFAIAKITNKSDIKLLTSVQNDLYKVMSQLSSAVVPIAYLDGEVKRFEQYIDNALSQLPPLDRFILPQGGEISSFFHILRVRARESERRVIKYFGPKKLKTKEGRIIVKYLNRLSDLFFMMARKYSKKEIKA